MMMLAVTLSGVSLALGFWISTQIFVQAMHKYKSVLMHDAQTNLRDMFVFIDLTNLWPALVCLATCLALISWLLFNQPIFSLLLALSALILPRYLLSRAVRARCDHFEQQLPDALLSLSSLMRAGGSLGGALKQVVSNAEAPFSQEFGLVLREQRVGISMSQALMNLQLRMPSESVQMTSTLMRVAIVSGGSVSDLLERLSVTIRARLHLEMKMRVLTSQGAMQAWIMGALPLILLVVLYAIDPDSISLMFQTTVGQILLAIVVVLEATGVYVLKRILKIQA